MPVSDYSDLFESAGRQYNVDPRLLAAMASVESNGAPDAVSPAGAQGLMQIMPDTARRLGVADPFDPKQAIPGAARLMAENLDRYGRPDAALMAYNAGTDQARWNNPETQGYVPKIIAAFKNAIMPSASAAEAPQQPQQPPADAFSAAFNAGGDADTPGGHSPAVAAALARAAAATAQTPANDAFSAAFTPPVEPPVAQTTDTSATSATPAQPSVIQEIGAGLNRAAHDVTDTPAELIARGASAIGADKLIGAPSGAETAASNAAARQDFSQQYGSSPVAQGVRIAGDVGASLVPAGIVGRAVSGAGDALLGGGFAARTATSALSGAAQGAASAAVTSGASDQPVGQQMVQGAELGGALGGALPAVSGLGAGIKNALVGGGTSTDVARLAQTARDTYGVPVTGAQISSSPFVKFVDSVTKRLPFSGAAGAHEYQQNAFNQAVSSTFGESAEKITPDVMAKAKTRLGQAFDDIASRTSILADSQLLTDLAKIQGDVKQVLPASEQAPVNTQITNVLQAALKGNQAIDGPSYQALTRTGSPLDRAMQSSDTNVRYYAGQVRNALNDALQRSAPPELASALTDARTQYKAMKTVEDLVEKSPTGDISPSLLMGRVRSSYGNMAYDGGGPLGELARIGQQFMKEAPSSGTAERSLVHGMLFETPAIITGDPMLGAQIAGGVAAGRAARAYLNSDFYTNMLLRNALSPKPGMVNQLMQGALPYAPTAGQIAIQRGGVNALNGPPQ